MKYWVTTYCVMNMMSTRRQKSNGNKNKRQKQNGSNRQQQGKWNISDNVVPVEVHQYALFKAEEKFEAIDRQRNEPFGLCFYELNRLLRADFVTFGIIEDGQQFQ